MLAAAGAPVEQANSPLAEHEEVDAYGDPSQPASQEEDTTTYALTALSLYNNCAQRWLLWQTAAALPAAALPAAAGAGASAEVCYLAHLPATVLAGYS